ncbi:MAG: LysR family transcriptional regulator [bacterium]|nr:LysR family transcriptional regulator [bacterium]
MLDLKNLNLNTLVVLDTLLKEQNVSRAAEKLKLTQPTVSNTLKQLRIIFDDDLLIRGPGNRMILSYRAKKLIGPVAEAMNKIQDVFVDITPFDPTEMKYDFKLGLSDMSSISVLPNLMNKINRYSDNISIFVEHLNNLESYDEFIDKKLDIAIGYFKYKSDLLEYEKLFSSDLVCIASKFHPAFQSNSLSIETFMKFQHIGVCYREDLWDRINAKVLERTGVKRNIVLQVPHFLVALSMLKETQFVSIAVRKIAEKYQNIFDFKIRDLPFEFPHLSYNLYWKKADNNNPAHIWLKELIRNLYR